MAKPVVYEETVINEIEKVRLMFSQFFSTTTDFSGMQVPSKHANIYNIEQINKESRKDIIL